MGQVARGLGIVNSPVGLETVHLGQLSLVMSGKHMSWQGHELTTI